MRMDESYCYSIRRNRNSFYSNRNRNGIGIELLQSPRNCSNNYGVGRELLPARGARQRDSDTFGCKNTYKSLFLCIPVRDARWQNALFGTQTLTEP